MTSPHLHTLLTISGVASAELPAEDKEVDDSFGGCSTTGGVPATPMLIVLSTIGGLFWRRRRI